MSVHRSMVLCLAIAALAMPTAPRTLDAQWVRTHEQFYYPGSFNWQFRRHYPAADRLFNAFDYGHAVLYEVLWAEPRAPQSRLEIEEYEFLTQKLLTNPPRLPLAAEAIESRYARLVPEAQMMFEWAHLLHRQLYDVLADERIPPARKDSLIADIVRYYRSRRDLAFSVRPKSMALMEGQPYSLAFRQRYPKFNGLIWSYHWLQVGLYEPLVTARSVDERQTGVLAALARFRRMIEEAPAATPRVMPMTAAVAPEFARRYPEAAIIFDNLHGLHDVISDILANPQVPRDRKRAEILLAASRYRDDTSFVMTADAWRSMAVAMGVENQGGPATGLLAEVAAPTALLGAPAAHGTHDGHGGVADSGRALSAPPSDSAAVAGTVARFHAALASGDSAAALALLIPDAVVLESGARETRAAYRAHHLAADIAFARAVRTERGPVAVTVRGDVAWASSTSTSTGEFRGRAVKSTGAELMVLVRGADGWRIASIHWSSR